MSGGARSRRMLFTKLGLVSLFVLSALAPATASAEIHHTWQAYSATVCYPNAQTCSTLTGSELQSELNGLGMPWLFDVRCDASGSYCPSSVTQVWDYQINGGWSGTITNTDPDGGLWWPGTVLDFSCWETDNYENYQCVMGTGGPGYSWVITVHY